MVCLVCLFLRMVSRVPSGTTSRCCAKRRVFVKVLCCRSPRLSKAARRRRAFCRETIWAAEIVPFTLERMGAVASMFRHERGPSFVRYSRGSGDRRHRVFMINLLINLHLITKRVCRRARTSLDQHNPVPPWQPPLRVHPARTLGLARTPPQQARSADFASFPHVCSCIFAAGPRCHPGFSDKTQLRYRHPRARVW